MKPRQVCYVFFALLLALAAGYLLGSYYEANKPPSIEWRVPDRPGLRDYPKNTDTDAAYADGLVNGIRQERTKRGEPVP